MTRISINLLGVERKEALQRKGLPIDKGWVISAASVLGAALLLFILNMLLSNWVANAEVQKAQNIETIKDLDAKLTEIKTLETERKNLLMEEKILRWVTGETYKWSYLLQEIRTLMPLDVVINDLKISADGTFTLNGTATDHRSVALFLVNLQSSKMLADATLQSSVKQSEKSVTSFVITCKKAS
ncbi:MAG: PilN domain-containing protein [Candidatus Sericytochromatia bacterium]